MGGDGRTVAIPFDPSQVRSVNAMFDPAKSDSANLLAANPLAGAVPLMWQDEKNKRKPKDLMTRKKR